MGLKNSYGKAIHAIMKISHFKSKGFTLIEIIIVMSVLVILVVATSVMVRHAWVTSNETAAQGSLSTFRIAMEMYHGTRNTYPANLMDLANTIPPFADSGLADGSNQGYNFVLSNASSNTYTITATPEQPNVTGRRNFRLTQSGEIEEI